MRDFFIRGGPLMWPLLACSLFSLAITLERLWFWFRTARGRRRELVDSGLRLAEGGRFDAALAGMDDAPDLAVGVLTAGLRHRLAGMTEHMEIAAADAVARMKRGMAALDTIITVAPLLGILGTVLGIIQSFRMLSSEGIQDPRGVVGGIAQALITTAAGLGVALATVIAFNFFREKTVVETRRIEGAVNLLEAACRTEREDEHAR